MVKDYCEILLDAVTQIVDAKIAKAGYDKTITAIITNNNQAYHNNKYYVQSDGVEFAAIGNGAYYEVGDEVFVTQPQSNEDLFIIIGKRIKEEDLPIKVADPFTHFVRSKQIKFKNSSNSAGSTSNIEFQSEDLTTTEWTTTMPTDYDVFAISADIKAKEITSYKLIFQVTNFFGKTYELILDSNQILGAINFDDFFTRQQLFEIEKINRPTKITGRIECIGEEAGFLEIENGYIEFGYKIEGEESLELYTNDSLEYTTNGAGEVLEDSINKSLYLKWIYTDEKGQAKSITYLNEDTDIPLGVEVRWYRYNPEGTNFDEFGGSGWERCPSDKNFINKNLIFNAINDQELYKVALLRVRPEDSNISSIISNVLGFTNNKLPKAQYLAARGISLSDGSNGTYNIWNANGFLTNNAEYFKRRWAQVEYTPVATYYELYTGLNSITWKIPSFNFEILSPPNNSTIVQDDGYIIIKRKFLKTDKILADGILSEEEKEKYYKEILNSLLKIEYCVKDIFIPNNISNYIICELEYGTEIIIAERALIFSKGGDNGTENTITVSLVDDFGNLKRVLCPGEEATVKAECFDARGNIFTPIKFSVKLLNAGKLVTLNESNKIKISEDFNFNFENNEDYPMIKAQAILEETENKPSITLTKYYPITIASHPTLGYTGAYEILYDTNGQNPQYDKTTLELLDRAKEIENPLCQIKYKNDEDNKMYHDAYPTITKIVSVEGDDEQFHLVQKAPVQIYPKDYYESNLNYQCGLFFTGNYKKENEEDNTNIVYLFSPLVITQSHHFSTIIDNWDGKFKIDESGNYVLASAYVGGSKNEQNEFTGVIVGELGTISDEKENITESGVFGYNAGAQTFNLNTDGSFILGGSGQGQIKFDGTSGIIEGTGIYLDLANGNAAFDGNAYFKGTIYSEVGEIGGYILAKNMLYSKDDENNYSILTNAAYSGPKDNSWENLNIPNNAPDAGMGLSLIRGNNLAQLINSNSFQGLNLCRNVFDTETNQIKKNEYIKIGWNSSNDKPNLIIGNEQADRGGQLLLDWTKNNSPYFGSTSINIENENNQFVGEIKIVNPIESESEIEKIYFSTSETYEFKATIPYLSFSSIKSNNELSQILLGEKGLILSNRDSISALFGTLGFYIGNGKLIQKKLEGVDKILPSIDSGYYGLIVDENSLRFLSKNQENYQAQFQISDKGISQGFYKNEGELTDPSIYNEITAEKIIFRNNNVGRSFVLNTDSNSNYFKLQSNNTVFSIKDNNEQDGGISNFYLKAKDCYLNGLYISKGRTEADKDIIYISSASGDSEVTDVGKRIVFRAPVEFADSAIENDTSGPQFTNNNGVSFLSNSTWTLLNGSELKGGSGNIINEHIKYKLDSRGKGLEFYGDTNNITYLNSIGFSLNSDENNSVFMIAYNPTSKRPDISSNNAYMALMHNKLPYLTINTYNPSDTYPLIEAKGDIKFIDSDNSFFTIKADGTGELQIKNLIIDTISLSKTGPWQAWENTDALTINGSLQATQYIGGKELWVSDDIKINAISIKDIYLKKNDLIINEEKGILTFYPSGNNGTNIGEDYYNQNYIDKNYIGKNITFTGSNTYTYYEAVYTYYQKEEKTEIVTCEAIDSNGETITCSTEFKYFIPSHYQWDYNTPITITANATFVTGNENISVTFE